MGCNRTWTRKVCACTLSQRELTQFSVSLVDVMPRMAPVGQTADYSIVQAARVSYGAGTKKINEDTGLIRYLLRHKHTSIFYMHNLSHVFFYYSQPLLRWLNSSFTALCLSLSRGSGSAIVLLMWMSILQDTLLSQIATTSQTWITSANKLLTIAKEEKSP